MTEKNKKRTPRSYSDEFKQQLIALYRNGKRNVIFAESTILPHPFWTSG